MSVTVKRILFFVGLFVIWQGLSSLGIVKEYLLPSPLQVFEALWLGFADMTLVYDLLASLRRLLFGGVIAVCIGSLLGIILAKWKTADQTLGLLILALQSVPSIVWLPLAMLWVGFNEWGIIFIVILGGTFVMTINMRIGVKSVPPIYIKAARTMGSNGLDLFIKVIAPAAVPHAVTGVRLAWAFGWRALMAGELLSTGPGLGYTLKYAADFGNMKLVIGVIIIIGIIGSIVDLLIFQRIEKSVIKRWGLEQSN